MTNCNPFENVKATIRVETKEQIFLQTMYINNDVSVSKKYKTIHRNDGASVNARLSTVEDILCRQHCTPLIYAMSELFTNNRRLTNVLKSMRIHGRKYSVPSFPNPQKDKSTNLILSTTDPQESDSFVVYETANI